MSILQRTANTYYRITRWWHRLWKKKPSKPIELPDIPVSSDSPNNARDNVLAELYVTAVIKASWKNYAKKETARINSHKGIYMEVSAKTGVPWQVIGVIHSLEANLMFDRALHNGDRIIGTGRKTYNEPKGRGPFKTWKEAAIDALIYESTVHPFPKIWTIGKTANWLEHYNGTGYVKYHPTVNTPYLFSGTQHYRMGKYVSDGKWDSKAVSKQIGCVPLLKGTGYEGLN